MEVNRDINKYNLKISIKDSNIYEEKKFPFSKYMMYTLKITTNKKSWEIKRRYKNFDDLHKKLKNKKILILPKLPPKKLFLNEDDKKERQEKLEKYLNELFCRVDVYKHDEVLEFIELEKEHFLMMKENLQDSSTNENSPSSDKFKSFITLKRNKSTDVLINENFFYSKTFVVSSSNEYEYEVCQESSIKSLINNFLQELNSNLEDKCKIIKDFEEKLRQKKSSQTIQREEIYKLLFGEKVEDVFLHGLIYHSGNIHENQIGSEYCLEYLAKLCDYQHNLDCDYFVNILKLMKLPNILQMKLDKHLLSNKKKVITAAYIILKNVINEEKGIFMKNIVSDSLSVERFNKWLHSMY